MTDVRTTPLATPRTDAACVEVIVGDTSYPMIYPDFARQLERELAERNEQLRQSCDEYRAEHGGCCVSGTQSETAAPFTPAPPAVRVALLVLLNHVEPGWDNCRTVVQAWLDGELPEAQK